QLTRLGGPNFHEIPINAPLKQIHNNQRDGMHRQNIPRGRVAYEPNSLGGGCPFQAGAHGFTSFPEQLAADKVRGKAEKFADHYSQATLFWSSQSPTEQQHIIDAFRFELTRVQTPAIRERMVSQLLNVDASLAEAVAEDLGIPLPAAAPLACDKLFPVLPPSPALSQTHYPGDRAIKARRIAILAANGVDEASVNAVYDALLMQGAVPRVLSIKLGKLKTMQGNTLDTEATMETLPSVLFDAVVVAKGDMSIANLALDGRTADFLRDQYRHCKPMLLPAAANLLMEKAGIPTVLPDGSEDPATLLSDEFSEARIETFMTLIGTPRNFARETVPPMV
ncbi:MAG TPA: catalase-related domain-containing protein, partial [Methylophilus sp.]